jgi:hypothetical protein
MPRHPWLDMPLHITLFEEGDISKISDSHVRVIDSRVEEAFFSINLLRVVEQFMLRRVHASVAKVKSPNIRDQLIDHNDLLMVGPEQRQDVVWMPQHNDVWVQTVELLLSVFRVHSEGDLWFVVHHCVDLDPFFSLTFQNAIQTKFLVICVAYWSFQVQLRREPPIGNEDLAFSTKECFTHRFVEPLPIHKPFSLNVLPNGSK